MLLNKENTLYDVLGIGNALVDVICSVEDIFLEKHDFIKGSMTLINAEQATHLYKQMGPIKQISGGSAANTLTSIAELGGRAAFIGATAKDAVGEVFAHDIKATGVDYYGFQHEEDEAHSGRCYILVTPDAQRTMCTYLGVSCLLPLSSLDLSMIEKSAITYVEGYLWDQEITKISIRSALETAKNAGRLSALSLSDKFCVDRHRSEFMFLIKKDIDIIFANESEIIALFQTENFDAAIQKARTLDKLFVLTRSEKGCVIVHGNKVHIIDALVPERLLDTTGAGDAFAAGFLYGLTAGYDYYICGQMGAVIASEIISHFGARPEGDLKELMSSFQEEV